MPEEVTYVRPAAHRACCWLLLILCMAGNADAFRLKYPAEYNPYRDNLFLGVYGGIQAAFGGQESEAFDVFFLPYSSRARFVTDNLTNYGFNLVLFRMLGFEVEHAFSGSFSVVDQDSTAFTKSHQFDYQSLMAGVSFELKGVHARHDSYIGVSYGYLRSALKYPYWWCGGYDCGYWVDIREGDYASVYVRGVFMEYFTYKVRYIRMTLDRWNESFLKTGNIGLSFGVRLF